MTPGRILRLILWRSCHRACKGCCNEQEAFAPDLVETINVLNYDYRQHEVIILTGGEPMLNPQLVINLIGHIRLVNPKAFIIMYTSKFDIVGKLVHVAQFLDGLTCTLHDTEQALGFRVFAHYMTRNLGGLSLRLNVFAGVKYKHAALDLSRWKIKEDIEWIKDCPLPEGEVVKQTGGFPYGIT